MKDTFYENTISRILDMDKIPSSKNTQLSLFLKNLGD
jgi:hypothetical protein